MPISRFLKKINSTPYIIMLGAALVIFLYLLARQFKTKHTIDKEVNDLQKQADSLQKNNDQLQGFISYFQTDTYKETVARQQLDLKKPGETVYSFSGQQANASSKDGSANASGTDGSAAASAQSSAPQVNAGKWWRYFFAKK